MDLVRDLLDKKLVDRNGREMGRVDDIVLEIRGNAAPRVTALEVGPAALAYRIRPLFGRIASAVEHAFGVDEGRPVRFGTAQILGINDAVKVDVAAGETPVNLIEHRLRRWLARIPGSS
jgi:sporulation protein YlmC with PRC-barrel domain